MDLEQSLYIVLPILLCNNLHYNHIALLLIQYWYVAEKNPTLFQTVFHPGPAQLCGSRAAVYIEA